MGELLRRRALMQAASGGGGVTGLIYETSGDISGWYDTGLKLFDTPKSFTIYCEATFNNYNWTGNAISTYKAIFGINGYYGFYVGRSLGTEYTNNTKGSTNIGRYTALVMNETTTDRTSAETKMTSLYGRANSNTRKKIAVTYDHTTRTVHGYSAANPPPTNTRWWMLSSDLITDLPIILNFRGADSVVNIFEVYDYCMTGEEVAERFEG
jgi:hypothetical protein